MFPAVHTMWLVLVVVGLNVLGTFVILIQAGKRLLSCRGCIWGTFFFLRAATARGQDFRSAAFKGLYAHEILGNALSATQQEVRVRSASNKDVL